MEMEIVEIADIQEEDEKLTEALSISCCIFCCCC